jgi:DNA polymerase-4
MSSAEDHRTWRVAAAQPAAVAGDLDAAVAAHADAVSRARADLVVFPELSLTGYGYDAPVIEDDDPRLAPLVAACRDAGSTALAGAPVHADPTHPADGGRAIGVLRVDAGGVRAVYRKMSLGDAETRHFTAGTSPAVVDVLGHRVGIGVCRDTRIAGHLEATAALGMDLYAAGLVHAPDELHEFDERARRIATTYRVPVVLAGFAGPTGGGYHETCGGSGVWDADGRSIVRAGPEPGALVAAVLGGGDTSRPWVLHVDLDQFIAAVEVLRRPELAGLPLIVGGRGDPSERAVVSTASYEAREFGVGSGMPLRLAARKAPDAVILPVDAPAYEVASEQVMAALRAMDGAVVEVLGWDEAFVGIRSPDPEAYARRIQAEVLAATRLHCSVGIGDNKIRAKIATGFGKPRGTYRLTAANWFEVMGSRPATDLWGVGSRVSKRLAVHGITTVNQLAAADRELLTEEFGPRMGRWYAELGRGIGSATVDDTPWVARGRSREHTYQQDLTEPGEVESAIRDLVREVLADVVREGRPAFRLTLKVRYRPFFTKTFGHKLDEPTTDPEVVLAEALALADRREPGRAIRLLGLRAEMTMPEPDEGERTPIRGRI